MQIVLKLVDGETVYVDVPQNAPAEEELDSLLNRTGAYQGEWVQVIDGRYVRREAIVSARLQEDLKPFAEAF